MKEILVKIVFDFWIGLFILLVHVHHLPFAAASSDWKRSIHTKVNFSKWGAYYERKLQFDDMVSAAGFNFWTTVFGVLIFLGKQLCG